MMLLVLLLLLSPHPVRSGPGRIPAALPACPGCNRFAPPLRSPRETLQARNRVNGSTHALLAGGNSVVVHRSLVGAPGGTLLGASTSSLVDQTALFALAPRRGNGGNVFVLLLFLLLLLFSLLLLNFLLFALFLFPPTLLGLLSHLEGEPACDPLRAGLTLLFLFVFDVLNISGRACLCGGSRGPEVVAREGVRQPRRHAHLAVRNSARSNSPVPHVVMVVALLHRREAVLCGGRPVVFSVVVADVRVRPCPVDAPVYAVRRPTAFLQVEVVDLVVLVVESGGSVFQDGRVLADGGNVLGG